MKGAMLVAGSAVLIVITGWVVFIGPSATDAVPADTSDPALEAQLRTVISRTAHKRQILNQVRAGQMTLWKAAEAFRDLHANDPTGVDQMRWMHPGCGDKELFCRWVINYARNQDDEGKWEPVLARLEQELESYRERGLFGAPEERRAGNAVMPAGRP
jgi:hypothetical protein